jgi:hypothetical protein
MTLQTAAGQTARVKIHSQYFSQNARRGLKNRQGFGKKNIPREGCRVEGQ